MEQVSKESPVIFDIILELYKICQGDWKSYGEKVEVDEEEITKFLQYAATFLHNLGNYFGKGDQKFNPRIPEEEFRKLVSGSKRAATLYESSWEAIYALAPACLGYPSESGQAQSRYYLAEDGADDFTKDEISAISKILHDQGINQENTRILKHLVGDIYEYIATQASTESSENPKLLGSITSNEAEYKILLRGGDHQQQLQKINSSLTEALAYCATDRQKLVLTKLIESFETGNMEAYKESQRHWVKDIQPSVENIFGFVEPYRDPAGVRAEFEGLVGLVDKEETKTLTTLAENSTTFIRLLPWTKGFTENDGKGPFEKELFEAPDFTSLHTLTYCSSIIFPGINLPNFNDIRQETGFKNVMIANSMSPPGGDSDSKQRRSSETIRVDPVVEETFQQHYQATFYLWVVFHELLGHGTGKLLTESSDGSFNFDKENPPINPVDQKPISSWYRPGETWTGLFRDIATTVDECRCEVVGAYFMGFPEILGLFGYKDEKECEEMEYNMYLQLGCAGLRALNNYIVEDKKWGQAHSRGHFAIMKILLSAGDGFLSIKEDLQAQTLTVSIDRTKIKTHGLPALSDFLLRLHMYRSIADEKGCREYYEELTSPSEEFLQWREMIIANKPAQELFVQDNTFLQDGEVILKEYGATLEGMIESWVDRDV
ncbi:hypothetical protein TWF694_004439 [Orbilia ellipsospora]|uniref:Dipeptidyl-peptidase III n=1 Tax=Orbilia ellipsospora TaxID=2528407 RepID=A0AAV9WV41_9PEZI